MAEKNLDQVKYVPGQFERLVLLSLNDLQNRTKDCFEMLELLCEKNGIMVAKPVEEKPKSKSRSKSKAKKKKASSKKRKK